MVRIINPVTEKGSLDKLKINKFCLIADNYKKFKYTFLSMTACILGECDIITDAFPVNVIPVNDVTGIAVL